MCCKPKDVNTLRDMTKFQAFKAIFHPFLKAEIHYFYAVHSKRHILIRGVRSRTLSYCQYARQFPAIEGWQRADNLVGDVDESVLNVTQLILLD